MPHPHSRPIALGVSLAMVCAVPLLAAPASAAPAPDTIDVQVLTINDFHGRIEANFENGEAGAAVVAGAVDAFEAENPNTLFVSAGDSIGASTFTSFIQQDNPTIDALVAAGLDLSAVGNHEFDDGDATLKGFLDALADPALGGACKTTALASNVVAQAGTALAPANGTAYVKPYLIKKVDGVDVGIVGVTIAAKTAN